YALAGLVSEVEIVAKGLDHVVSCDAKVRLPGFNHRQHGSHNTANGSNLLPVSLLCGRNREKVAEQLVGAVDQMNDHATQLQNRCSTAAGLHMSPVRSSGSCNSGHRQPDLKTGITR